MEPHSGCFQRPASGATMTDGEAGGAYGDAEVLSALFDSGLHKNL